MENCEMDIAAREAERRKIGDMIDKYEAEGYTEVDLLRLIKEYCTSIDD